MAFCRKCGKQIGDEEKICPSCGTETEIVREGTTAQGQQTDTPPETGQDTVCERQDINDNKIMGILSYLWLLVLVPIFSAKQSRFARYHANQGLVLAIFEAAYMIIQIIISSIFRAVLFGNGWSSGAWAAWLVISFVLWLCWIPLGVFAVIGIKNALNGRCKPLPLIGKIKILK